MVTIRCTVNGVAADIDMIATLAPGEIAAEYPKLHCW